MENLRYDLLTALPEMILLGMGMLVLIIDLFLKQSNRIAIYSLSQVALLMAAYVTFRSHAPGVGYAFTDSFVDDAMADVLKLMIYLGTSLIFVYTRQYIQDRNMFRGEFYALVLFAVVGMMMMVSGQSMLTLYIGLELLSLSMYALVAFDRDNARAVEAAMKYFVLGALASGMLLYGMSMIYGATGSLNLAEINTALMSTPKTHSVLILGLVFIVAGLAFKLGAVPFQMWVPDVYEGSPTAVTMIITSVPKLAAFAFVIRLLAQGLQTLAVDWQQMLLVMSVMSIIIGNVTAIAQTNIKRMLAYSTISHIGFVLLGLMSASINGFASALFYISSYVLMSLAGFGMILLLSRKGFEAEKLEDLKGLNQRSPWLAFLMLIVMFSMAGVPPTLGFYAKFAVLQAALQAALQAGFVWIVVFAVLMAVVGAFYYLRVIKLMYFDEPTDHHPITAPRDMRAVLSVNAFALLAIGLMPQGLMSLCAYAIMKSLG